MQPPIIEQKEESSPLAQLSHWPALQAAAIFFFFSL